MYQRYGVALVTLTLLHTTISSFDTCDVVIIIMSNVIVFVVPPVFLLQPRDMDPPPGPSRPLLFQFPSPWLLKRGMMYIMIQSEMIISFFS